MNFHSRWVTLVNRTSKPIEGVWNGRHFDLAPGEHKMPLLEAEAIKRQNPVMGTLGGELSDVQFLCGIVEKGDDCSPIEQSDSIELLSPSYGLHEGKTVEYVPALGRPRGRADVFTPPPANTGGTVLGTDSQFEKP